jgi:hypothetical protein
VVKKRYKNGEEKEPLATILDTERSNVRQVQRSTPGSLLTNTPSMLPQWEKKCYVRFFLRLFRQLDYAHRSMTQRKLGYEGMDSMESNGLKAAN